MPDLDEITCSRPAAIAAVTDFYEFLTRMYMKESQIVTPPASGWPCIVDADPQILQPLGKSDEVLSLLAHLPYIRSPGNWHDDAEAAPGCVFADWPSLITDINNKRSDAGSVRIITEGASFAELAPPHTIGFTCGSRENPVMVLDTKLGIMHWEECPPDIENNQEYFEQTADYEADSDVDDDEAACRESAPAWAIADFFDILKAQYKTLRWIPISHHTVRASEGMSNVTEQGMASMLQDIYRQHG
jgi:hypothetical protein